MLSVFIREPGLFGLEQVEAVKEVCSVSVWPACPKSYSDSGGAQSGVEKTGRKTNTKEQGLALTGLYRAVSCAAFCDMCLAAVWWSLRTLFAAS